MRQIKSILFVMGGMLIAAFVSSFWPAWAVNIFFVAGMVTADMIRIFLYEPS